MLSHRDRVFKGPFNKPLFLCCSYKKLAEDVKPGMQVLCADGSIVLEVLETDAKAGIVTCRCQNNAKLGWVACTGPCRHQGHPA